MIFIDANIFLAYLNEDDVNHKNSIINVLILHFTYFINIHIHKTLNDELRYLKVNITQHEII